MPSRDRRWNGRTPSPAPIAGAADHFVADLGLPFLARRWPHRARPRRLRGCRRRPGHRQRPGRRKGQAWNRNARRRTATSGRTRALRHAPQRRRRDHRRSREPVVRRADPRPCPHGAPQAGDRDRRREFGQLGRLERLFLLAGEHVLDAAAAAERERARDQDAPDKSRREGLPNEDRAAVRRNWKQASSSLRLGLGAVPPTSESFSSTSRRCGASASM